MIRAARCALFIALLGLAHCKQDGAESPGPAASLSMTATPNRVRPDGMRSTIRVAALDAGGRFTSGDVLVQATCGTLNGVDATMGQTLALRGRAGAASYSCDPAVAACCVDGLDVAVTATLGSVVTTATITLDQSATGGGGTTSYNLGVSRGGTGSGTVSSTPSGIDCGSTCTASFTGGTTVTLTATPASGSTFGGWSGACSGTGTTCTVSMSAARSVTATFDDGGGGTTYSLDVSRSGTGSGTVSSTPSGIACGSTCSASFASGTTVTLSATPASGSTFGGWSGACTGTSTPCTVSMTAARSVTATFASGGGGDLTFAFDVAPFSPNEVAAWDLWRLAHLDALHEPLVGFQTALNNLAYFGDSGDLYYIDRTGAWGGSSDVPSTLRRFVPNPFERTSTGGWRYPAGGLADDPILPTPVCLQGPASFVLQQGAEDYLFPCFEDNSVGPWYDRQGTERVPAGFSAISWNANGAILIFDWDGVGLNVIGTDRVQRALSRTVDPNYRVRPRAHADGFWVVSRAEPAHRYLISATGVVTDEGALTALPADYSRFEDGVLDVNGDVFLRGYLPNNRDFVTIRRPLDPSDVELVALESLGFQSDGSTTPPTVRVEPPWILVTGP